MLPLSPAKLGFVETRAPAALAHSIRGHAKIVASALVLRFAGW